MFERSPLILNADTDDIVQLFRIADGDPKTFFVGANFENTDIRGTDLRGFKLDRANFRGAIIDRETQIDPEYTKLLEGSIITELRGSRDYRLKIYPESASEIIESISREINESPALVISNIYRTFMDRNPTIIHASMDGQFLGEMAREWVSEIFGKTNEKYIETRLTSLQKLKIYQYMREKKLSRISQAARTAISAAISRYKNIDEKPKILLPNPSGNRFGFKVSISLKKDITMISEELKIPQNAAVITLLAAEVPISP